MAVTEEQLASLRALTSAELSAELADELLTANRCPARWDAKAKVWLTERADVHGAAAEWWERRAVQLEAASAGQAVTSKRVGDASVSYDGKSASTRALAMARRMARRSCRPDSGGARTVELLGPDVRKPDETYPFGGYVQPTVGEVAYQAPRPAIPGVDPVVNDRERVD